MGPKASAKLMDLTEAISYIHHGFESKFFSIHLTDPWDLSELLSLIAISGGTCYQTRLRSIEYLW